MAAQNNKWNAGKAVLILSSTSDLTANLKIAPSEVDCVIWKSQQSWPRVAAQKKVLLFLPDLNFTTNVLSYLQVPRVRGRHPELLVILPSVSVLRRSREPGQRAGKTHRLYVEWVSAARLCWRVLSATVIRFAQISHMFTTESAQHLRARLHPKVQMLLRRRYLTDAAWWSAVTSPAALFRQMLSATEVRAKIVLVRGFFS